MLLTNKEGSSHYLLVRCSRNSINYFANSREDDLYRIFGDEEDYYYEAEEFFDDQGFSWQVYPGGVSNPALWVFESKKPDHAWAKDPANGTVSNGNIVRSGP